MRTIDPSLELIACGSSGPDMPTFLEWDREVLEECFPLVDAISLHRYYGNRRDRGNARRLAKYLAMNLAMEQQIDQVAGRLRLRAETFNVLQAAVAVVR